MTKTLAQCLASYFGDPGKFSMVFSIVFQASTGENFGEIIVDELTGPANLMLNIPSTLWFT